MLFQAATGFALCPSVDSPGIWISLLKGLKPEHFGVVRGDLDRHRELIWHNILLSQIGEDTLLEEAFPRRGVPEAQRNFMAARF